MLAIRYNLGMNKLPKAKRIAALNMLVEGSSMRSVSRVVSISINTVTKLLVDAGTACERIHDALVYDVQAQRVEVDEIWAFCYAKEKTVAWAKAAPDGAGDVWTWTAIDRDSKLILSWYISPGRGSEYAIEFMDDVRARLANRIQLTSDGLGAYFGGRRRGLRWRRGLCPDCEAIWACPRSGTGSLQSGGMHRGHQEARGGKTRLRLHQHVVCGATQPNDKDVT